MRKLQQAIKAGDTERVTELITDKKEANTRFTKGWTPLHTAVKHGKKAVIETLLNAGADVNVMTEMHETPLDVALRLGNKQITELIRKNGARSAAEVSFHGAIATGDLSAVKKHIKAGADIDHVSDGVLPLCLAFERRRWEVAALLLRRKSDVNKRQKWEVAPLHVAAESGAPQTLLQKMLKLGATIDPVNENGDTPLCCAAEAGHEEIVDWLLNHGADIAYGHEQGITPVSSALRGDHVELASHLIDRGSKCTLHQAVQCNHLARARQKLNAGADVNHEPDAYRCETPLEMAIWNDSTEMVALLLEFGADPNQQSRSFQGQHSLIGGCTSLHKAVQKGSAKMVKLLLAHGADPEIQDADGMSPVELANRKNRTHLANLMEAHIDKKLSLDVAQSGIEQLHTVQKVAELLSVDNAFVLELVKTRKITCLKLDENTMRISAGSVQRYLAKLGR